jgi:hypothetical protein
MGTYQLLSKTGAAEKGCCNGNCCELAGGQHAQKVFWKHAGNLDFLAGE